MPISIIQAMVRKSNVTRLLYSTSISQESDQWPVASPPQNPDSKYLHASPHLGAVLTDSEYVSQPSKRLL